MVSATEIWAARRAKYSASNKGAEGWQRYLEGPHRKTAPPKPKAKKPFQLWDTPNNRPPLGWEGIDTTCKMHAITLIYRGDLKLVQIKEPALPGPMFAENVMQARKALGAVLAARMGKPK